MLGKVVVSAWWEDIYELIYEDMLGEKVFMYLFMWIQGEMVFYVLVYEDMLGERIFYVLIYEDMLGERAFMYLFMRTCLKRGHICTYLWKHARAFMYLFMKTYWVRWYFRLRGKVFMNLFMKICWRDGITYYEDMLEKW